MNDDTAITSAERTELAKLVRLRGKLAKQDVEQRQARLLADVEAQLAARYGANHAAWADVTAFADKVVSDADAEIARRCKELGIAENLRPSLQLGWFGRGENADRERRTELRRVAQTELEARAKNAKLEVDRAVAERLTHLAAGGLSSSAARAFLASMPTCEELLPSVSLPETSSPLTRLELVRAITGRVG